MKTSLQWLKQNALIFSLLLLAICQPIPQAQDADFVFEENIMVPMRDGVKLATNLFLPSAEGAFPTILIRSPYDKRGKDAGEAVAFVKQGYAVVYQDCRGRFDSEGEWDPFRYDGQDGYDTQEWVGQQPWCNGTIGTFGGSYVGYTQWSPAPLSSRYLTTMLPLVPFGKAYDVQYVGGAFQLALSMGWGTGVSYKPGEKPAEIDLAKAMQYLPLNTWDTQLGKEVPYLRDWVNHSTYDDYWKARGIDDQYETIRVPILNIGGWYDIFAKVTPEMISEVREKSKNPLIRRNVFCIMGPWGHGVGPTKLGELEFGEASKLDLGKLQSDWFAYWLKGENTGVEDWPAFKIFIMGENVWRDETEWPLARTQYTSYYLHSQGKANTKDGDGFLKPSAPLISAPDQYVYDPANPVPTKGGNNLVLVPSGPYDQSEIESRPDVLVYTTAPLLRDTEVTGPVHAVLHAASTAPDTDFTAKLVDVHPDGKAYNLCEGIIRARYRQSVTEPTLIEPGKIEEYTIDMWVTANLFKKGHRIRLEISSSNFPRFDRNPNTGKPFGTDTELVSATQTIYHDAEHPSRVILPIIPR
jgi:putative CocE/NonD family hydrolase